MCEYEDFYQEPSEFEHQIDEFKQSLMNSVRDEYKAEMERLRKENEELQMVKQAWDNIRSEYASKLRELEYKMQNAQKEARNTRFTELMKDFHVIAYRATTDYQQSPKCDSCNDRRQIKFESPSGKEMFEECDCAKKKRFYAPEEFEVAEFTVNKGADKANVWYRKRYEDSEYYHSSDYADSIYKTGTPYEEIGNYWGVFFRDKEECQAYCDWLTDKESKEE